MPKNKSSKTRKPGRPTKYSPQIAEDFCLMVSTTTIPIPKICKSDRRFPSPANIYLWILRHKEFRELYARARENRCELLADQILQIADTAKPGVIRSVKETEKGTLREFRTEDMIRHRELQVDARKWLLAKLRPGQYGDKLSVDADVAFVVPQIVSPHPNPTVNVITPGQRVEIGADGSYRAAEEPKELPPADKPAYIDVWVADPNSPEGKRLDRQPVVRGEG